MAVTHDDCLVRADWLERLAARLNQVGEAIVTGRVEPEGEGIVLTVQTSDRATVYTSPILHGDSSSLLIWVLRFASSTESAAWMSTHHLQPLVRTTSGRIAPYGRASKSFTTHPSSLDTLPDTGREDLPALYRRYARGQGAFYGTWLRRGDAFIAGRAGRDLRPGPLAPSARPHYAKSRADCDGPR